MTADGLSTLPILAQMRTNKHRSVEDASMVGPILLVFLRHFGCTFCREALHDLSLKKEAYEKEGVHLLFVHMADSRDADSYFAKYNIDDPEYVSDENCRFYAAMGLGKGTFSQLFGLQVMIRGVQAGLVHGRSLGRQFGDGFQMPGIFLVQNGIVRDKFIHRFASDRPDYDELISCCIIN
jgi:peroxiredoxin